jgi:hypothetical protein
MLYQIKDVVETTAEYGGRQFVILNIENNRYYSISTKDKKRYWLDEDQIRCKIGVDTQGNDPSADPIEGSEFAQHRARAAKDPAEKERWEYLALLKPGDKIDVTHQMLIYTAEFIQINVTKPKKVFRATMLGRAHDFNLMSLYFAPDLHLQPK